MTALVFDSPVSIGLPDAPEAGTVIQPENPVAVAIVLEGPQGIPGPAGDFPAGGAEGQVLAKASAADSDVEWVDVEVVGGVGSEVTIDADGTLVVDGTTVDLATDGQLSTHTGNTSNPHAVTKTQVGLGNVDNTSDVSKPVSTLQAAADAAVLASAASDATTKVAAETSRATTAEALLAPKASPTFTGTVSGVTKAHVGLSNVDNTTDAGKPVSTATQTALDLKAPIASPTFTGTVAGVTKSHVGLGNVDNTADTAKPVSTAQQTALDLKANLASPTFTGTVSGVTKSHVGLGNVDNTADTAKPVSTAQQTALDLKANLASPALTGTPTAPTATGGTNTTQVATTAFVAAALSGGGVTLEQVYDALATVLVAGTNMTITPNDGADTITFAASGGGGSSLSPLLLMGS